jgi:hypothetical protein
MVAKAEAVVLRDVYGRVQYKSITNMSCYPPRHPRLRYPPTHYAPTERTVEQPLTTPIPNSGRYSKRQSMHEPVSSRSVSYGYVRAGDDDRSQQKRRVVSGSAYDSRQVFGYAKDHLHLDTQRYHQPNAIDHQRDWDASPSKHVSATSPTNARSIRNGTDRTSYEVSTLPARNQPMEKPLPGIRDRSNYHEGSAPVFAAERLRERKQQREGIRKSDDLESRKGQHHARSSSDGTERIVTIKPSSPTHNPSSTNGISFDRKQRSKDRPHRSRREKTPATEPVRREGMDVDEVEEEITCPMYVSPFSLLYDS